MMPRRILIASLLFAVLASSPVLARAQQAAAKDGDLLVYYCQNLAIVTVRVFPARVEVTTANRKATLVETVQPSAVRYSDGSLTLSGLGELVRLEEPGAVSWCRLEPAEIPWQEARFRGIEFRAAGDPAWSLEIDSGVAVEFAEGQGAARVVTKFPPVPISAKDTSLTFTTTSGPHALAVAAEQRPCHHSGSTMTLSVTVMLDGKTYRGCGRRLAPEPPEPK